jgi:type II secretory pathway pseudopilin PulG
MTAKQKTKRRNVNEKPQAGFSILELILASAILMVGIISVVQLVPASLQLNANNRFDTMATVIAQRELDQMVSQPLDPTKPTFTDTDGKGVSFAVRLSGPGLPGASVLMDGPSTVIDFSPGAGTPPDGFYNSAYTDASGATFELRWAVIPEMNSRGQMVSRRIIIGCKRTNSSQPTLPVTLDTLVQK